MLDERFQIAGERVVVIADGRLAGAAKATAVVGDDTISIHEQVPLLPFPRVAIQRIAMDQNDRLTASVILVVDLDRAIVLGSDDERGHCLAPCPGSVEPRLCACDATAPPPHRQLPGWAPTHLVR